MSAPIRPPTISRRESSRATSVIWRLLRRIEYEADVRDAGGVHDRQHLGDRSVRHVLVGLKIDALPGSPRRDTLECGAELVHRHDALVQPNDAIPIDGYHEAALCL